MLGEELQGPLRNHATESMVEGQGKREPWELVFTNAPPHYNPILLMIMIYSTHFVKKSCHDNSSEVDPDVVFTYSKPKFYLCLNVYVAY
jgi:hypothetical protein